MEGNIGIWILQLLGRLHPMVVHFPIGILVVALGLEVLTINSRRIGLREGINMVNISWRAIRDNSRWSRMVFG